MKAARLIPCIAAALLLAACGTPRTAVSLTVMQDVTDTMASRADTAGALGCFGELAGDNCLGASFRALPITDAGHGRAEQVELAPVREISSNPMERRRLVGAFLADVSRITACLAVRPAGLPHSSVYAAVAREADRLAACGAERKVLAVYSDLRENGALDLHSEAGLARYATGADLAKDLERIARPGNLRGVEVHLVYEARGYGDYRAFALVADAYRQLLEGKGAKVVVDVSFNP